MAILPICCLWLRGRLATLNVSPQRGDSLGTHIESLLHGVCDVYVRVSIAGKKNPSKTLLSFNSTRGQQRLVFKPGAAEEGTVSLSYFPVNVISISLLKDVAH